MRSKKSSKLIFRKLGVITFESRVNIDIAVFFFLQVVFFAWTIYLSTVVSKGGGGVGATEEA